MAAITDIVDIVSKTGGICKMFPKYKRILWKIFCICNNIKVIGAFNHFTLLFCDASFMPLKYQLERRHPAPAHIINYE